MITLAATYKITGHDLDHVQIYKKAAVINKSCPCMSMPGLGNP
jgi:hypothetical protein